MDGGRMTIYRKVKNKKKNTWEEIDFKNLIFRVIITVGILIGARITRDWTGINDFVECFALILICSYILEKEL